MGMHTKTMDGLTSRLSALSFVPIPTAGGSGPAGTGGGGTGPRMCEACAGAHAGTYASGRFCSAPCAKKVGARRKWAAAPKARRAKRERAPCEGCKKIHDRTYASGRFCSVHCARRVAAARKWDKSRSERSRRLDAIRPAVASATVPAMGQTVLLAVAPTPPSEQASMQQQQQQRCTACPCGAALGVVYPPPQDAPQQLFYAHPLPWTVVPHPLVHPLALVPLAGPALMQGPAMHVRPPTVQLARRPVTPPQAQRPKSPMVNGTHTAVTVAVTRGGTTTACSSPMQEQQQRHTAEGAASEALLCLGVGDPNRSFATLPRSVKVPADD